MRFSIIQKLQLEGADRIDAEYFQSEYLDLEKKLANIKTQTLGELSESIVNFGAYSLCNYIVWEEVGVPYINVENVKDGYLDFEGIKFISESVNEILKKSKVTEGEIILPMAGSIGNAAVAHDIPLSVNSNQATAKIKLKNNISSYFVAAFLNSYYGKLQTRRQILSSVQPNIFLWQIKGFIIPEASLIEQKLISDLYLKFLEELENSKKIYHQAENLLLQEVGLLDFKPKEKLSYIINYSDVENVDRVDADYFQPKYEELLSIIKNIDLKPLEYFIENHSTGYPYESKNYQESGKPLIRINNIKKGFLDLADTAFISERDFGLSPKDKAKSGDIVLSMSGSIGQTAKIPKNIPECCVNQRILKFSSRNIEPECLVLILNSTIGSLQLERIGTGGVQTNISYKDIKNVLIPVLPKETQEKIADLVKKSHEARKKSKELLEEAKRKVEEMIEKGQDKITF